ncbi:MAG: PD40 domain-containing protein [Planctomycetes bacterium]|jgi:TolB protein|nr:PD40 domain-containing protein [Planctomycetota bacterium]
MKIFLALFLALLQVGCASLPCPIAGARAADELIQPGETHFARLWQITAGGQNAEGYWNPEGNRLVFQYTNDDARHGTTWPCDRIFVTDPQGGAAQAVSDGRGVTTCSYFLPNGKEILFASTQQWQSTCPPKMDHSKGYTWAVHPEYDLWIRDLQSGAERRLTELWGYDAEATVSPLGDRIVFTSTRSGDIELWTCNLDGSDLKQVTHHLGYDGGAFFSHDGKQLVFRCTEFSPAERAQEESRYRDLLAEWKVRPQSMELYVCNADGSERRQLSKLGGANFAPYFYPDDRRVIFSSNHASEKGRNFDLYSLGVDGQDLERITHYEGFDSFPMFSPDGNFLVFASNRGGSVAGETNLFIAEWRP